MQECLHQPTDQLTWFDAWNMIGIGLWFEILLGFLLHKYCIIWIRFSERTDTHIHKRISCACNRWMQYFPVSHYAVCCYLSVAGIIFFVLVHLRMAEQHKWEMRSGRLVAVCERVYGTLLRILAAAFVYIYTEFIYEMAIFSLLYIWISFWIHLSHSCKQIFMKKDNAF